jgi:hypothetical protein
MIAMSVYEPAHATCGSPPFIQFSILEFRFTIEEITRTEPEHSALGNQKSKDGEDRNRTYLAAYAATTVLKTARATRHPSLSERKKTSNVEHPTSNAQNCDAPLHATDTSMFDVDCSTFGVQKRRQAAALQSTLRVRKMRR